MGILFGNKDGTFRSPQLLTRTSNSPIDVKIVDVNLDGNADIISNGGGGVNVFLGNGDGNFNSPVVTSPGGAGLGFSVGDFNSDGLVDFAIATDSAAGLFTINLGVGDGTFVVGTSFANSFSNDVTSGDVNRDGIIDHIVLNDNNSSYTVNIVRPVLTNEVSHINLLTQSSARDAITSTNSVLERIAQERGFLGSHLARLSTSSNALRTSQIEYQSAYSRIVDTDVAVEAEALIRTNIAKQAAASVLAQANQEPTLALLQ